MWVLVCTVHLTACSYFVTYRFWSKSTLYSCLNVKEHLARNRSDIWSLSDCNGTRTHNHLVHERTLNHLAKLVKWLSCVVSTSECRFTLKCLRDMIRTYSQMHHTSKYSQHGSIIWRVWLNGWLFVYKLSGCGFESRCNHLNFRYCACFEEVVPWYLDNYRVHI